MNGNMRMMDVDNGEENGKYCLGLRVSRKWRYHPGGCIIMIVVL